MLSALVVWRLVKVFLLLRTWGIVAVCSRWILVLWTVLHLSSSRVCRSWEVRLHRDHVVARENRCVFSASSRGISVGIAQLSIPRMLSEALGVWGSRVGSLVCDCGLCGMLYIFISMFLPSMVWYRIGPLMVRLDVI